MENIVEAPKLSKNKIELILPSILSQHNTAQQI